MINSPTEETKSIRIRSHGPSSLLPHFYSYSSVLTLTNSFTVGVVGLMAGATAATFPPNPFLSPTTPKTLNPKPFPLRFQCPKSSLSLATLRATITARYGGGFRPNTGDSRRPRESRQSNFDPDPALDLSTIRSPSVRLIDAQQNMVGIVPKREAVQLSEDAGLDLVILSPDADPPVVKIMDYKKYRYELQKKKREQQKKSAASRVDIKEVKMGYNIDSHDYSVRLRAAQRFLNDGDKVKVIVNLKGRQNEFRNIAIELIKRFQNDIGELAAEESKNFRDQRNIFILLIPNKTVQQKAQEQPKEKQVTEASAGI